MMIFTHFAVSMLLALLMFETGAISYGYEFWLIALAGILPDIDIFFEHRKTFHRPFQFALAALAGSLIWLITNYQPLILVSSVLTAMFIHAFLDLLSNGKTIHPSIQHDDRCIYNHLQRSWIKPLRLVSDGSKGDFIFLSISVAGVAVLSSSLSQYLMAGAAMALGSAYSFERQNIDDYLESYDRLSEAVQEWIGFGPEVAD